MSEEVYYDNVCCCGCSLQEGVGWIASIEFLWGLVNGIVGAAYIIKSQNDWKSFGDKHEIGIIGVTTLHCIEMVLAVCLMITSSKRIRGFCFAWIGAIVLVFVAELAFTILDPFSLTFVMMGINPIRIYFAFIVWSFASEILQYPQGPPITRVITQPQQVTTIVDRPVYASSPVIVPSYGYGGGYPGYYGGYYGNPYGGYRGDALLGLALGTSIGLGYGGYGGYYGGGMGYYDDCYF